MLVAQTGRAQEEGRIWGEHQCSLLEAGNSGKWRVCFETTASSFLGKQKAHTLLKLPEGPGAPGKPWKERPAGLRGRAANIKELLSPAERDRHTMFLETKAQSWSVSR